LDWPAAASKQQEKRKKRNVTSQASLRRDPNEEFRHESISHRKSLSNGERILEGTLPTVSKNSSISLSHFDKGIWKESVSDFEQGPAGQEERLDN
jgi:hypothetical protein